MPDRPTNPPRPRARRLLAALAAALIASATDAAIIQRTITIDGDTSDWENPTDITANDGQFATDPLGEDAACSANPPVFGEDLDCVVQSTGRDLELFAFTYDDDNLYMLVERYASSTNQTDWWFYIDVDDDGLMCANDAVFHVNWQGSNRKIQRSVWSYTPADDGAHDPDIGDGCDPLAITRPIADPDDADGDGEDPEIVTGADGYDMPGTIGGQNVLDPSNDLPTGGSSSGVRMETFVPWSELGLAGPSSIQFHISASNGTNLPKQLDDNMDGPGSGDGSGGAIVFTDLALAKSVSKDPAFSEQPFDFTVTLTNSGDVADTVEVTDTLPAGLSLISATATQGTYDAGTGIWSLGAVADGASETLTLTVSGCVTSATDFTNDAAITDASVADTDSSNDTASVTVTLVVGPDLVLLKSSQTTRDPVNDTSSPKAIPGADVRYEVLATNQGFGDADDVSVTDTLPADVRLFVGDLSSGAPTATAGNGPVIFTDGSGDASSGLTYTFDGLASTTDSLAFSDDGGASFDYVPTPDAGGFDPAVDAIEVTPSGSFSGRKNPPSSCGETSNSPATQFSVEFRARLR